MQLVHYWDYEMPFVRWTYETHHVFARFQHFFYPVHHLIYTVVGLCFGYVVSANVYILAVDALQVAVRKENVAYSFFAR
jgi:hypothetical protein